MKTMTIAVFALLACGPRALGGQLIVTDAAVVVWQPEDGRVVRIGAPNVTGFDLVLTQQLAHGREVRREYAVGDGTVTVKLTAEKNALVARMAVALQEPVTNDLEVVFAFEVEGEPARRMGLPERNGVFRVWPMSPELGGAGKFELGNAAKGPVQCSTLGMPVVGLLFGENEPQLAVAADPYCGSYIQAEPPRGRELPTRVALRTTYTGSVVPLLAEERTFALAFHRGGADGTCRAFYRTIPEIEPGAPWTQAIHLVYYDYNSRNGGGWEQELKVLAHKIPFRHRGRVAVCLHGWYDYFQQYAYDHRTGKLFTEWVAFPGTHKIPMSLAEMHRRLKLAKELGFRVLLYFADGTNSDSGAPGFREEYVLKDENGGTFPGWKGPDSLGQPLMMDPSAPGMRDWHRGYLKALLDQYGKVVDGFVWDETFYIKTNFVSYPDGKPAYADRAMMGLVSELTQMTQAYRKHNPDLVFLASDLGHTSYALVAHGTFQDSEMAEGSWGPSMFANYRNCLWSCNWFPISHASRNEVAAEKYGLPQGLSAGWGDDRGPSRMPPALLDAVVNRFTRNVESERERLRDLPP